MLAHSLVYFFLTSIIINFISSGKSTGQSVPEVSYRLNCPFIDHVHNCYEKQPMKHSSTLAGIYLLKNNSRNTRTKCDICSRSSVKH